MRPDSPCIYCGTKAALTQEHIFGRWLKANIKSHVSKTSHLTSSVRVDPETGEHVSSMAKGRLNRPGSLHSHQLKLVCRKCNNEWMGTLQEAAKPHILALARGDWSDLSLEVLKFASAWAAMVTMCLEFADLNSQTVPPEARKLFSVTGAPSSNWIICFGECHDSGNPGAFWHRAGLILAEGETIDAVPKKTNTQTTTIHMGRVFIHTLSAPSHCLPDADSYVRLIGMRKFWPLPDTLPPNTGVFNQSGVAWVATKFWADMGVNPDPHFGLLNSGI